MDEIASKKEKNKQFFFLVLLFQSHLFFRCHSISKWMLEMVFYTRFDSVCTHISLWLYFTLKPTLFLTFSLIKKKGDQWRAEQNKSILTTIISSGNGIHSFYCRKRAKFPLKMFKKKVNKFAKLPPFMFIFFSHSLFIFLPVSWDAHLCFVQWWASTSFSMYINALNVTVCVLFIEQYTTIQSYKFPWNLLLSNAWNEDNEENNNFLSFHFVSKQSTHATLHLHRNNKLFLTGFPTLFQAKLLSSIESVYT